MQNVEQSAVQCNPVLQAAIKRLSMLSFSYVANVPQTTMRIKARNGRRRWTILTGKRRRTHGLPIYLL